MTAHQQEIAVLVAGLCLAAAVVGVMLMLGALAFPALSKTGQRLFASGIVIAVTSSLGFLAFACTASFMLSGVTP